MFSPTGLSPTTADHPRPLRLTHSFLTAAQTGRSEKKGPTTPHTQPLPGITCTRFSHPPRSLATTNGITICFLFLRVLRCFTSPRSPPHPMYSDAGDTTSLVPGFPIRTSSDQRSVDSSPRLIAASYVLHRLPVPRHPPCALKHLQHKIPKMRLGKIAHQSHQKTHPPHRECAHLLLDARNHYPQIKHHTPPPKWSDTQTHCPTLSPGPDHTHRFPRKDEAGAGLLPQSPIVCSVIHPPKGTQVCCVHQNRHPLQGRPIQRIAALTEPPHTVGGAQSRGAP